MLNQPAAENGSNRGGDRGKTRPCADRLAPVLIVERCTDNGEASRYKQGSSHSLNASGNEQLIDVRSRAASGRSGGEDPHTNHEDQTAANHVAQGASDKNQRSQEQTIR